MGLVLDGLPVAVQKGLRAMVLSGGRLPMRVFRQRYGGLRSYRPWRQDGGNFVPWEDALSVGEHLWFSGLVYLWPPGATPREASEVVMAAELWERVAEWGMPQGELAGGEWPRPSGSPDLLWDVVLLLATAVEEDVGLINGRWFPPRILKRLAQRMKLEDRPDFALSRSERKLPYVAFVHYVAEAAGLVSAGECLTISAVGWQWLEADRESQWQQLWDGWQGATREMTTRFGFAWGGVAATMREGVWEALRRLPLERFRPLAEVVYQAYMDANEQEGVWEIEKEDDVVMFIAQSCFWFGLVTVADRRDGEEVASEDGEHFLFGEESVVRLTTLGAWLLGHAGGGKLVFPDSEPCRLRRSFPDEIVVPLTVQPVQLVRLVSFCIWLLPDLMSREERLHLDERRVGQCVAAGMSVSQIVHDLERALGQPVSRRQGQRLRRWAKAAQQVRLRHVVLLETADAELMGKLRSQKRFAEHLGAPLSPTRSETNPAELEKLVQELARLGMYASVPPELALAGEEASLEDGVVVSEAEAGLLLATAEIYRRLGAHVALPFVLPASLLARLGERLPLREQVAAEQMAMKVVEQIEGALRGYLALPAWYRERDVVEMVGMVETAVAKGRDLILSYQNRHEEGAVVRRVTPYWLETRHGVIYLQAYCHLREEERVFRVDRIEACEVVA